MKFICIQQCFRDDTLWDVGAIKTTKDDDKTDWSAATKKNERICWKKVGEDTEDAVKGEKKTVREINMLKKEDMILYVQARYKGTIVDPDLTRMQIIEYIKMLENAKSREDKIGVI